MMKYIQGVLVVLLLVPSFAAAQVKEVAPSSTGSQQAASSPPESGQQSDNTYIVRFKQKPTAADVEFIQKNSGSILKTFSLIPGMVVKIPWTSLPTLAQYANIESVETDKHVVVNATELDNSWGVKHIGAAEVQARGVLGQKIKVAVLDTGIDYNHPELRNMYAGGYNFVANNSNPMDDNGHGTHVAGIIAAAQNNSGVVGVAPQVELYALKVLDAQGSGRASSMIAALEWAINHGITITNSSYGSKYDLGSNLALAFEYADKAGVLNIAAAGNSGSCSGDSDTVQFPARYPSVVAVGAVDSQNKRACFSSSGSAVSVSAPGVAVVSTYRNGTYMSLNGTSMAVPHVTGVAALVAQAMQSKQQTPTSNSIRNILVASAEDLGQTGKDAEYGYGLVRANSAIDAVLGKQALPQTPIVEQPAAPKAPSPTPSNPTTTPPPKPANPAPSVPKRRVLYVRPGTRVIYIRYGNTVRAIPLGLNTRINVRTVRRG